MIEMLRDAFSNEGLKKNKGLMLLSIVSILLALLIVLMAGKTTSAYQHAQEVQKKIADMKQEISDFEQKAKIVNESEQRPVTASQIDKVQSDLVLAVRASDLTLLDYKIVGGARGKNQNFQPFEMSIRGEYANVIRFLQNFRSKDALIRLAFVSLKPTNGLLEAKLVYRIFIK